MPLQEIKIRIPDLEKGMYVSRLDKPWLESEYTFQGFYIEKQEDIDLLFERCEYVYIDVERSRPSEHTVSFIAPIKPARKGEVSEKEALTGIRPREYIDQTSLEEEMVAARKSHDVLSSVAVEIMDNIASNKKLDFPALKKAIDPMLDSIIRNPDAYAWLTRMKRRDTYTYDHSVSAAIWAVAFGRHLGFPRKDLRSLALGGLLFDIGKMRLPEQLINNPKTYNKFELKIVRQHVEYSVEILKETSDISDDVLQMVYTHHERHDGSGYPRGLAGNMIPIFGKIAGIVDCYVAIISERPFVSQLSPHEAVKKLYEWRDVDFQAELVEQFIQVIGVYPVGTLVELTNGLVGVIVAQNREWRLKPRVMLMRNAEKQPLDDFNVIDLYEKTTDDNGEPLHINHVVAPGMYGIDPDEFYL